MVKTTSFAPKKMKSTWPSIQRILGLVGFHTSYSNENPRSIRSNSLYLVSLGQRVAIAFQHIPPTETEMRIIHALIRRPGANAKTLSNACGWKLLIWHTHFGLMCQKRIDWLLPSEFREPDYSEFIHGILLDYNPVNGSFKLKAEVLDAFHEMGFGEDSFTSGSSH
jgi:hypothetical protein